MTDTLRGEMNCRDIKIDDLEKSPATKDARIERLENNLAWLYHHVKETEDKPSEEDEDLLPRARRTNNRAAKINE